MQDKITVKPTLDLDALTAELMALNPIEEGLISASELLKTAPRPRTDLGNAERLVDQHGDDLRYCPPLGGWLVWDGQRWQRDSTGEVYRRAHEVVRGIYGEAVNLADSQDRKELARHAQQSESKVRIDAMVALAQAKLPAYPENFDIHPWLLNVENGTLDLRTGELYHHQRSDFLTTLAPTVYDPDALAPTWDAFLARIIPDPETRAFLQRAVGYSLTGMTRAPAKSRFVPICPMASRRGRRYATALVQARSQMPMIGRFGHSVRTATLPGPAPPPG